MTTEERKSFIFNTFNGIFPLAFEPEAHHIHFALHPTDYIGSYGCNNAEMVEYSIQWYFPLDSRILVIKNF